MSKGCIVDRGSMNDFEIKPDPLSARTSVREWTGEIIWAPARDGVFRRSAVCLSLPIESLVPEQKDKMRCDAVK